MAIELNSSVKLSEASKALLDALSDSDIPKVDSFNGILDENYSLSAELKEKEKELEVMANTTKDLESSKSKLEADNRTLSLNRDKAVNRIHSLEQGVEDRNKRISNLEEKCNRLSNSNKKLEKDVERLENNSKDPTLESLYQNIISLFPWKREGITSQKGSPKDIQIVVTCNGVKSQLHMLRTGPDTFKAQINWYNSGNGQSSNWTRIQ